MRMLLDTNVLIPLEDSKAELSTEMAELTRLANENNHQLLFHPASVEDIGRDPDLRRREVTLSRMKKYSELKSPPDLDRSGREMLFGLESKDNDRVDNLLLISLQKNCAAVLITEDNHIHKKAERVGIEQSVLRITQAVELLRRLHNVTTVTFPNIEERHLYELDLQAAFFDSLRNGYPGFDERYNSKSRDGRKAWVQFDSDGQLGAICIYKVESNPPITDDFRALPGRALKLCTFKVAPSLRGRKLGELLLKIAIRYAAANACEHLFVTMRPGEHDYLEELVAEFGFEEQGKYKGDIVYVKRQPAIPPRPDGLRGVEYVHRYYPHFSFTKEQSAYIVPIRPEYHAILFPDAPGQQQDVFGSSAGNAIKQAYLCHANIRMIAPSDVVFFYRSHDAKAITTIGIVEKTAVTTDVEAVISLVAKRTVFSLPDLQEMVKKPTLIIVFWLIDHLKNPITYNELLRRKHVNGNIQTIRSLSENSARDLLRQAVGNGCFISN